MKRKQRRHEEEDEKAFPELGHMIPWPARPAAKKRPRPEPKPTEGGGGNAEQELDLLKRRQDHLQRSAAAALASQYAIPLPAAEIAARLVDQAMRDAMMT